MAAKERLMTVTQQVPMPLDWHPAYADKTWLLDWLGDDQQDLLRLPVMRGRDFIAETLSSPVGPSLGSMTLTKRQASGPAPYVGRPYVYLWMTATDEVGRSIAGESKRRYDPKDEYRGPWADMTALPVARFS
jgi:hypothetical protein